MIYLDNNATTPILPQVTQAMLPYLTEEFGNPSGIYTIGHRAKTAIEKARGSLARILNVLPTELTFTGSGTEAINQGILGALWTAQAGRDTVVISAIEHAAVAKTAEFAERFGFRVRVAPLRLADGKIDAEPFAEAIDDTTALVCAMHANNEVGAVLPIPEIGEIAHGHGALLFCDCVQSFGKLALEPRGLGCDMAGISAHKFHGPKGVGCLFVRQGLKIPALIHGGPQENERRGGTENVAGIVGMAKAAEEVSRWDPNVATGLRDVFEEGLKTRLGKKCRINFEDLERVGNTSSVQFPGMDANVLLIKLDRFGICASTGAACHSGSLSTSSVLLHMGLPESGAKSTIRFSFAKTNTPGEVDQTLDVLSRIVSP